MNIADLQKLTLKLRPLTDQEQARIRQVVALPFERAWHALEHCLSGKLLLDALCRTDLSVEESLLLFVSDHVSTADEARAWVYLLNFRRTSHSEQVTWDSFRAQLPERNMWPDEVSVRECATAELLDDKTWDCLGK